MTQERHKSDTRETQERHKSDTRATQERHKRDTRETQRRLRETQGDPKRPKETKRDPNIFMDGHTHLISTLYLLILDQGLKLHLLFQDPFSVTLFERADASSKTKTKIKNEMKVMISLALKPIASEDRLPNPMLVFSFLLNEEPFVNFALSTHFCCNR